MTAVRTTRRTPNVDAFTVITTALGFVASSSDIDRVELSAGPRSGLLVLEWADAPSTMIEIVDALPAWGEGDPAIAVLALRVTPDVPGELAAFTARGLLPRISSDSGVWADFSAPDGGLLAVHGGASVEDVLSFEYAGELEPLQARLAELGLDVPIIDENFGLTLRIPDPDGGEELWVNQVQTELHGYRLS